MTEKNHADIIPMAKGERAKLSAICRLFQIDRMNLYHHAEGITLNILELLALAVGLSMDAFAVSVCKGITAANAGLRTQLTCGVWFGLFQAAMPAAGFYLGSLFYQAVSKYAHWFAFILLAAVGLNLIKEAQDDDNGDSGSLSPLVMLMLASATSVDALAVGMSLAMSGVQNIWPASLLIGIVTFLLSGLGVRLGGALGNRFQKQAQISGGLILLLLGVKTLLEHL